MRYFEKLVPQKGGGIHSLDLISTRDREVGKHETFPQYADQGRSVLALYVAPEEDRSRLPRSGGAGGSFAEDRPSANRLLKSC